MYFARIASLSDIALLITHGCNVHVLDSQQRNVLFYIVDRSETDIIDALLLFMNSHVNLHQRSSSNQNFLQIMLHKQHYAVIQRVVDVCDPSTKNDRLIIGTLLTAKDDRARAILKAKLGGKNFKYFDNKYCRKPRKNSTSMLSQSSTSNSLVALNLERQKKKNLSVNSLVADERRCTPRKAIGSAVSAANAQLTSSNDKAKAAGWLGADFKAVQELRFKTLDCLNEASSLRKNSELAAKVNPRKEERFKLVNAIISVTSVR
jgi:hypothetical protein